MLGAVYQGCTYMTLNLYTLRYHFTAGKSTNIFHNNDSLYFSTTMKYQCQSQLWCVIEACPKVIDSEENESNQLYHPAIHWLKVYNMLPDHTQQPTPKTLYEQYEMKGSQTSSLLMDEQWHIQDMSECSYSGKIQGLNNDYSDVHYTSNSCRTPT